MLQFKLKMRQLIIWGISCLLFLLILGYAIFYYLEKAKYNNLPYEKVIFSNTKYPKEQKKAFEILNSKAHLDELYRNIYSNFNKIDEDYIIRYYKVNLNELYIDKIDLNNDKILDIIVFIKNEHYKGSIFYTVIFYIIDAKNNWTKISEGLADENIIIFKQTHNGYRDIGFVSLAPYRDFNEGKSIWKYNGKEYDYEGFLPLTKQDWEVFKYDKDL